MIHRFNRFFSSVVTLLLVIMVGGLLWSKVTKQEIPISFYHVLTGSMSPKIPAGGLVIVKKVPEENLKVGDIVTFKSKYEILTHRITEIEMTEAGKSYVTKGDRNQFIDQLSVTNASIQGKVIITLPYLGRLGEIIKTPKGTLALILTLLQLLLMLEGLRLIKEIKEDKATSKLMAESNQMSNEGES